jgi:Domain of unknown function (DUF4286)
MIIDRVEITSEARSESHWLCWTQQVHISAVIRAPAASPRIALKGPRSRRRRTGFVMQYHCRLLEEYHRYRDDFIPGLQKATLPGKNQKRKLSLSGNRILGNVSMGNKPEGVT